MNVFEAWNAVMADVQGIRKGERNAQQGFNFRGIDSVLNTVGPALRAHHVTVVPTAEHIDTERYQTAKGGLMQGVIVRVSFTVYGPEGDHFTGSAFGQAADAGDKAVSKAHSVAYRTFLLQSLTVPTDEPDPDLEVHTRVASPPPNPTVAAKNRLAAAVAAAGIDLAEFMDWAASDLNCDIRTADTETLDGLTRRVETVGKTMIGGTK